MTLDEISALVQTGESETLEFKSTTGTRREAVRTICAMLNQDGGQVLFGVTPEGNVVGQQVSERTIEALSNELQLFEPHESRPWNPLIAGTFYRRGVIERWGSGTLKIAEQVSAAGLPPPEIEDDGGCVTVRFRHGQFVPQQRIESIKRQETILTLLERAADGLALRDIQVVLGPEVSQRQVRRVLEGLRNSGLVESTGPGPRARWKRTESD